MIAKEMTAGKQRRVSEVKTILQIASFLFLFGRTLIIDKIVAEPATIKYKTNTRTATVPFLAKRDSTLSQE